MDLTSYLSIFFFFNGLCLITMGMVGRFRISKLSSEFIPEFSFYEYIDFLPLLVTYYNSVIVLGVPFSCLGLTITYGTHIFIINSAGCIALLLYTNLYHRRLLNKLKTKDLNLKTLSFRLKNKGLYKVEKQLAERNISYKVQNETYRDWEHADVKKR